MQPTIGTYAQACMLVFASTGAGDLSLAPWHSILGMPPPLPDGPFKPDSELPALALGPARAPGNAGYSAFQHKKRRTKSRRACAEAAPRAVATLVRPGEATVILAYHSDRLSIARDRFEVLGVRGDINKSSFGTEDKCNPLEAIIELRYDIKPCGASRQPKSGRHRDLGMLRKGGVVVSDRHAAATSHGGHGERIDLTVMIQSRPRGTVTAKP
jgi:hypothetical protein